jgi:hypothetical protein
MSKEPTSGARIPVDTMTGSELRAAFIRNRVWLLRLARRTEEDPEGRLWRQATFTEYELWSELARRQMAEGQDYESAVLEAERRFDVLTGRR